MKFKPYFHLWEKSFFFFRAQGRQNAEHGEHWKVRGATFVQHARVLGRQKWTKNFGSDGWRQKVTRSHMLILQTSFHFCNFKFQFLRICCFIENTTQSMIAIQVVYTGEGAFLWFINLYLVHVLEKNPKFRSFSS